MDLPEEACLGLGPAAEHIIDRGFGRRISKQRATKLVRESAERGAVGNYSRGNLPFMLKSYYLAEMPYSDKCSGCGACEEYCPVRAVAVNESGVARVNAEMCCGCRLCVLHCGEQAIRLKHQERNVFLPVLVGEKRRIT